MLERRAMSHRKLKKWLKRTPESFCTIPDAKQGIERFTDFYGNSYWMLTGMDYWGEAYDQQISTKDVENLLQEYGNKYKLGRY